MIKEEQELSVMCIGQDKFGNIKLSLKAMLPQKKKKVNVVKDSFDLSKQKPDSGENSPNHLENQIHAVKDLPQDTDSSTKLNLYYSSTSPIVIRSTVECDEEEKSAGLQLSLKKNTQPPLALKSKSISKPKKVKSLSNELNLASSDSGIKKDRMAKPFLHTEKRINYGSNYTSADEDEEKVEDNKRTTQNIKSLEDEEESTVDGPIDAKKLKLGMKVTAKILKVRKNGLRLDLGGGIHGMHLFEVCVQNVIIF